MANMVLPFTFLPNTLIKSSDVNADLNEIINKYNAGAVQTDVAKTITVGHTFTPLQTFNGGVAIAGNSTLAGILSGLLGLSVASGGALITAGGLTVGGIVTMTPAAGVGLIGVDINNSGGTNSFGLRVRGNTDSNFSLGILNAAGGAYIYQVLGTGAVIQAGALTVQAGGAAITGNSSVAGNLAVTGVVSGGVVAVAQTADITNTTVTPANTSLAVTLGASQTWKIDYDLMVSCNNVGGIVLNFAGPSGVTGAQMLIGPTSAATTVTTFTFGSFAASSTWSTYNSAANAVYLRGSCYVVTAGTGGAFTLQYAAGTAAQTAKVVAGSTLHATRIS